MTPGGAKPVSTTTSGTESPAGKIWLKPKKEEKTKIEKEDEKDEKEKKEEKEEKSESKQNGQENENVSNRDFVRSSRPNSLVAGLNGDIGFPLGKDVPEGPVKTTEIKSPEEATGVKSPSPEHWKVQVETGAKIDWTEGSNLLDLSIGNDSNNNESSIKEKSIESSGSGQTAGNDESKGQEPLL